MPLSKDVQLGLFDELASEMERLDGEALFVRSNRPTPWGKVVQDLREGILRSGELGDFSRALMRLDYAYPNLHSRIELGDELRNALPGRLSPSVRFGADWVSELQTRFRVSSVDPGLVVPASDYPQVGDELVAINGKAMSVWSDLNFDFCKLPLRAQCDTELPNRFVGRVLPLTKNQRLTYALKRADRTWTIQVPIKDAAPASGMDSSGLECKNDPNRYKGYSLGYSGNRLCVFESPSAPSTAIMRITSFDYRNLPDSQLIRGIEQEVDAVYPWWKEHAIWDHLVIDLIDNGGGNAPIPYYRILLQKPFQEQYFRLKKNPELLDGRIRKGIFWGSGAQEIWFQDILKSGVFANTATGELLPALPMFCADESRNCTDGSFEPREHPFNGRVSVLLNQWCVSSCDGFVYAMKEQFGPRAKFYGHPQAADTAYSRLTVHAFLDSSQPKGFYLQIHPIRMALDTPSLFSQTLSVTRSVTASGTMVSGAPVALDGFVAETLENRSRWVQEVLDAALGQANASDGI